MVSSEPPRSFPHLNSAANWACLGLFSIFVFISPSSEFSSINSAAILSFWPEAGERVFAFKEFAEEGCLIADHADAAPYADGDFVDYDIDKMMPFIAEIERCLAQTIGKFLRQLQLA